MIKEISDQICFKASKESNFHPIDRYFLQPYIEKILSLDRNDFLLYNLEHTSNLYSSYLMLCLPELWIDIELSDLEEIIKRFTTAFSFFALIYFTYKFVEIDIIEFILKLASWNADTEKEISTYLKNQYYNFFKDETDYFYFEDHILGVNLNDWLYIKQRLILDDRIRPALPIEDLRKYVNSL